MQHFLLQSDLTQAQLKIEDKDTLHQLKTVMRFKVGTEVMVMDGCGSKAPGKILELHKKAAVIELGEVESAPEPARKLRLYCAISKKPSTFELIVQKATEIGVTDIIPLVSKRCQVDHLRKADRLELIIKEACEQCERLWMPTLHEVMKLEDFCAQPPEGLLLAGDARETDAPLSELLSPENVNLVIGPEGGLTEEELQALRAAGVKIFLLGNNVLRMETAAIAALSLIQFGKV